MSQLHTLSLLSGVGGLLVLGWEATETLNADVRRAKFEMLIYRRLVALGFLDKNAKLDEAQREADRLDLEASQWRGTYDAEFARHTLRLGAGLAAVAISVGLQALGA